MLTVCLSDTVERLQTQVNSSKKRNTSDRRLSQQRGKAS